MPLPNTTPRPQVLVVDDVAENRELLRDVLAEGGYETLAAEDGKEAIAQAIQHKPALILLDIMMPEMDGYTALEALKDNPETCDIPVIFMTALSDVQNKVKGIKMGAVDYITKPFQFAEVLVRVHTQVKIARLQHELVEANTELEAANELKSRFFRIARHDLRNPIAVVQLTLDFLKNMCETQRPLLEFEHKIDLLRRACDQIEKISENYLDNEQVFSLMHALELAPQDVVQRVRQIVEECEPYAREKKIRLTFSPLVSSAQVEIDECRFNQAVTNLISNALKFSAYETRVDVRVESVAGAIQVSVKDEGPGVPESERSRLFQEFAKLSNKPTGGETSSGLGLWICQKVIEAQKGSVGADFPPDGGSVFWVRLPYP